MNKQPFLLIVFCILFFQKTYSQTGPSTEESINWINEKLLTFSSTEIRIQNIKFDEKDKVLSIIDARGDESTIFTKQLININFLGKISVRKDNDFIAIDLIPKAGRSCGMIGVPFFDQSFDYPAARKFIKEDIFPISSFSTLGHVQITLKKSSEHDQIPERIVAALNQILANNGIILEKEVF
jgi:hypothetical protein